MFSDTVSGVATRGRGGMGGSAVDGHCCYRGWVRGRLCLLGFVRSGGGWLIREDVTSRHVAEVTWFNLKGG